MIEVVAVEDYPTEDMFGSEIRSGDHYYLIGHLVLLDSNVEDYLIEVSHAKVRKAK